MTSCFICNGTWEMTVGDTLVWCSCTPQAYEPRVVKEPTVEASRNQEAESDASRMRFAAYGSPGVNPPNFTVNTEDEQWPATTDQAVDGQDVTPPVIICPSCEGASITYLEYISGSRVSPVGLHQDRRRGLLLFVNRSASEEDTETTEDLLSCDQCGYQWSWTDVALDIEFI
jgi:hypothetical protein